MLNPVAIFSIWFSHINVDVQQGDTVQFNIGAMAIKVV